MTVYSVVVGDNSDLIEHISPLYLPDGAVIRDVTWGKGVFWRKLDTSRYSLQGSDLGEHIGGHPGWDGHTVWKADFTALPDKDESADIVVLDPPYIHNPSSHSTDSRYNNVTTTGGFYHRDIRELYIKGMAEAYRILKPGGTLMVKCKDQVESGIQCWAHIEMLLDAEDLGMYGRDLFVLVPTSRTSMNRWTTQKHARKVHSFLWIFDKPATPAKHKKSAVTELIMPKEDIVEKTALDAALEALTAAMAVMVKTAVTEALDEREGRKTVPTKTKTTTEAVPAADGAKIRAWLTEHGHVVKPSGRIPKTLLDAYRAGQDGHAVDKAGHDRTSDGHAVDMEAFPATTQGAGDVDTPSSDSIPKVIPVPDFEPRLSMETEVTLRYDLERVKSATRLSNDGLASILGVSAPTVAGWLRGSKPNGGKEARVRGFIADMDALMEKVGRGGLPEAVKSGYTVAEE